MTKKVYRISIVIQEYEIEGFYNIFDYTHQL